MEFEVEIEDDEPLDVALAAVEDPPDFAEIVPEYGVDFDKLTDVELACTMTLIVLFEEGEVTLVFVKIEEFPVAEAKLNVFELLFPKLVVFPSEENVKVGPVGWTVVVDFVRIEKLELLDLAVAVGLTVVELAGEVTIETDAVDVTIRDVLVTFVIWN